jgi:tetratricopeptide (TPR) repeat protein
VAAITDATFSRNDIRALLKLWHQPSKLGEHPLAAFASNEGTAAARGVALRERLRMTLDALKPEGEPDFGEKRWRPYLILSEQYVNARKPEYLADLFGLVRGSFHQEQARSLELLGEKLREWHAGLKTDAPDSAVDEPAPPFLAPRRSAVALTGRAALLATVKHALTSGSGPVAVHGLPGVGKTALAVELAHDPEMLAACPDGVLWTGPGTHPDTLALLGAWATALGFSQTDIARLNSIETRRHAVHGVIGLRRMLLVIDDVWRAADAEAFLLGGPNCAHLLTTRAPALALELAADRAIALPELSVTDSIALLTQQAPHAAAHTDAVQTLVRAAGGLPLALTLMGGRLRAAALGNQTRRVAQTIDALQREFVAHPGAALADVIASSVAELDAPARDALAALSVFPPKPGTFGEDAAVAACDEDVDVLDALVDAGLLESSGERLMVHQSIADAMRAQLARPAPVITRLLQHYETTLHSAPADVDIEREHANMLAALTQARDPALALHTDATRVAHALAPVLERRGLLTQAEQMLDAALSHSAPAQPDYARSALLRGQIARRRGQFDAATAHFEQAAQVLDAASDATRTRCELLLARATLANDHGEREQADAIGQEALALARALDDAALTSSVLTQLAAAAGFRAQFDEAQAYLLEARDLARRVQDARTEGLLSLGLGLISAWLGDVAAGEVNFERGYALARSVDARETASLVRSMQGWINANLGNYEQAVGQSHESIALIRQGSFCESAGLAYTNLGFIAMNRGETEAAARYVEQGSEVVRQIGHKEGECMMANSRARLACELGDWAQAEAIARDGIQRCDALDYWELMPSLMATLGEALTMQGHYDDADGFLMTSLMLAHNMRRPWLETYAYAVWGGCYLQREEVDRARDMFDEGLRIAERLGARPYAAMALFGLARVAGLQGDAIAARALGERSFRMFDEIGHVRRKVVRAWLETVG